jgi:hypothetical protein
VRKDDFNQCSTAQEFVKGRDKKTVTG